MSKYSLRLQDGTTVPLSATEWKRAWAEAESQTLGMLRRISSPVQYKAEVLKDGASMGAFAISVVPSVALSNPSRR